MTKNNKYDLENRTYEFTKGIAQLCREMPKTFIIYEYMKQVIRSSASIGANYIEANEGLSEKDTIMRIKISRKEAKETIYWLKLIKNCNQAEFNNKIQQHIQEATELKRILSKILINISERGIEKNEEI